MVEIAILYGLVVGSIAADQADAWSRLPLIVSAIVALVGVYMGWQAKQDNKRKDQAKEKLDAITIGQTFVVESLNMCKADNAALRMELVQQQKDHETEKRGWQAKIEQHEDKIISLEIEVRVLKRRLGIPI